MIGVTMEDTALGTQIFLRWERKGFVLFRIHVAEVQSGNGC